MKKIYLIIGLSLCAGLMSKAQTVTPELVNMMQLVQYQAEHPGLNHLCATCPKGEADGGWKTLMPDLPIPPGANIKRQNETGARPTNPNTPLNPLTPSPPPTQNFLGHVDPGFTIPPDTHGAIGLNHIVTATNDFIRIHNKSGLVISTVDFATFTGFTSGSSDPYVIYDQGADRWYMSAIDVSGSGIGNRVMLAVSQTGDPTGNWFKYRFVPNVPSGQFLLDHPYTGFDDRWIVISGRKFPAAGFSGPILFIFDKANVLANGPVTFGTPAAQAIEKTTADGDAPLPVTVFGTNPSPGTFYVLQSWSGAAASIRLTTVTGNLPNATWNSSAAVFPSGGTPWTFTPGNVAEQVGETRKLATNDSRISCGVMMNGNIWCCHHIGISPTNVSVQWWQLNGTPGSSFGSVLQRGRIGDTEPRSYRWFPSIAVNGLEDVLIGYTYSSNLSRVSAAYSFRSNTTPPNTTDDEYVYKVGLSTYFKDYGGSRARWGDYSHTALDPADGSLWTIQEYADQRSGAADESSKYGVWWAQVTPVSSLLQRDATIGAIVEPASGLLCKVPVQPKVTIRSFGTDTLKSVQVGMILDGVPLGTLNTITGLSVVSFGNSATISLTPNFSVTTGTHTLKVFTINPNGLPDLRPRNDTASVTFTVAPTLPLPYTENFTGAAFPPNNGSAVINPDAPEIGWTRTTVAGRPGPASMRIKCYDYGPDLDGQRDIYRTPKMNSAGLDSMSITFNVAYWPFPGFADSLNVLYSPDCGVTWFPTGYSKGGAQLATIPGDTQDDFVPAGANEWRTEKIMLKGLCEKNLSSVMIGFECVNGFGNNIYVDSIAFVGFNSASRNAILKSINQPLPALCAGSFTPEVTFGNAGLDTIRTLKISYQLDGGTPVDLNWTGTLAKCDFVTLPLASGTAATGTHTLKIYTSDPNGLTDLVLSNDTLTSTFSVYTPAATPLTEDFESTTFPRANWGVQNVNGGKTWERSTNAAKSGVAAMLLNNPDASNSNNALDYFITPIVLNSSSIDSMFVDFDLSYKPGPQYPGSTVFPLDTLEVMATTDCGVTFSSVWKKWGNELQTLNDPSYSYTNAFIPTQKAEWQKKRIYLTPFVGASNYQLYFVAKSNRQNNIWIDNINISSKTLPQRLKDQGYLIYPNPFNNTFLIHHSAVEPPVDLQAAQVYNAAGQLVWERSYNGNADRQITVDLKNAAKGMYVLKMIYTNKTIVERLIKN